MENQGVQIFFGYTVDFESLMFLLLFKNKTLL